MEKTDLPTDPGREGYRKGRARGAIKEGGAKEVALRKGSEAK